MSSCVDNMKQIMYARSKEETTMNENAVKVLINDTRNIIKVMLDFVANSQKLEAGVCDIQKMLSGETYKPHKVIKKLKKLIDSAIEVNDAATHEIDNNNSAITPDVMVVILDRIDKNNTIMEILIALYENVAKDLVEG